MSKITNVRLPNATVGGYDPAQFNQLVRSLEQIVFQLNNTYTPVTSENTAGAATWMAMGSGAGRRWGEAIPPALTQGDAGPGLCRIQPLGGGAKGEGSVEQWQRVCRGSILRDLGEAGQGGAARGGEEAE